MVFPIANLAIASTLVDQIPRFVILQMGNVIVRRKNQDVNVHHVYLDITFLAMTTLMITVHMRFVDWTRKLQILLLESYQNRHDRELLKNFVRTEKKS